MQVWIERDLRIFCLLHLSSGKLRTQNYNIEEWLCFLDRNTWLFIDLFRLRSLGTPLWLRNLGSFLGLRLKLDLLLLRLRLDCWYYNVVVWPFR